MQMPKFLRELMQSPAYMDKNSDTYAMAEKYLKMLYPGALGQDATGRLTVPEYDMTLTQFHAAQAKLEDTLKEAIAEAEAEYEKAGQEINVEDYVELKETIDVKVLMPDGRIENKRLEVYILELPEADDTPNDKPRRVWRWHSENGDNTCDECAQRDGEIYDSEDDIPEIPVHRNCRCSITEEGISPDGRTVSVKSYTPKTKEKVARDMVQDKRFEEAYNNLKEPEGGYTDGKNQVRDEPTNLGIKQSTLNQYTQRHPDKAFPADVKDLKPSQAKEIYKDMYWDKTKIPQIENARIRNAVFDMRVMSGPIAPTKMLQQTLNEQIDAKLPITGYLGEQTVKAINSIPENRVDSFMTKLIENRIQSLQRMKNWPSAQKGWTKRTRAY